MITLIVDGARVTLAAFARMDKATITWVDAADCTGLTSLDLPAATRVYAAGCTGLTSLDLPAATRVDAAGCTGLTSLDLPTATWVDASGCTGLTSLDLPAATRVDAAGCTGLTSLDLPAATRVDAAGCTASARIIPAGRDSRGYAFVGLLVCGEWRIAAGCRYFTLRQALAHWGDNPERYAIVERIAAEIAEREAVA